MASTYSEYLRLELIGTGDQTGTWGSTTNTNLGTLLDQAVAGTATIDVTLGDVTLTALNGASDQSRQAILKITGTPIAARNVIAPEQSKWYLISNDCGQTITLKGASTTGYEIATGETLLMFWNGTDFVPGSSTALGYTPVNKAGDTMSGALYLPSATPTLSTQAATKGYVDSAVSGAVGSNFVLKTGDTMTGALTLSGAPSTSLQAATKGYVDNSISGAGYATQLWVTQQNYATNSTSSLTNYYTKTDADNRYVSTSTQNLQYYPLTTTVANTYATISSLSSYVTSTYLTSYYSTTSEISTALANYMPKSGGTFVGTVTSSAWNMTSNSSLFQSGSAVHISSSGTYFYFYANGNALASGTWQSGSDRRIKENIAPVGTTIDKVMQLNPVEFSMKKDQSATANRYGLIAQELEQVFPYVVDDTDTKIGDVENVKVVSYMELIPVLVKAIQELKTEINELKAAK